MSYKLNDFSINVGFKVDDKDIHQAVFVTNTLLMELPATLYKSIDYKTTSAMIGAIFCDTLASLTESMVNPIEKGHPDIIPLSGANATEEELRKYHQGLEIKCTIGNIKQGANLRAGQTRISKLTGVTWQAHHREVKELLGIVWDFVDEGKEFNYPTITGAFYSDSLVPEDWGTISGTTGRNTKVSGMKAGGKRKMGAGWVLLLEDDSYLERYKALLKLDI
jgi:hypothetical protein